MKAPRRAPSKTSVLASVKAHDFAAVRDALRVDPEFSAYRGKRGENLLHICCAVDIRKGAERSSASIRTADVLIAFGLDVDGEAFREGDWKATPLWYAIGRGKNHLLAKHLIARGATPEHCMWAAAFNDDATAIRLLYEAGAKVDPRGPETPLLFAVKWSRFAAAKTLLECGANANARDPSGKTALHLMLKKRSDPGYVRMFVKHGARVNIPDDAGLTAQDLAARIRDPRFRLALAPPA